MNRVMVALLATVALPSSGVPQVPVGSEFQVNTYATYSQRIPSVASHADASFVVVWETDFPGALFGQRFDANGAPAGGEFLLNSHLLTARSVVVAPAVGGAFVAAWQVRAASGDYNVWVRRYEASGNAVGVELQVNSHTTGFQSAPAIATDASGNFVVVWASQGQDGSFAGIFGQRFSAAGTAEGPEFRVNTLTTGSQYEPVVSSDPAGNFVVVWYESFAGDVLGQRFNAGGARQGGEFRVNSHTTFAQRTPAVATDPAGNFMVVWESLDQEGGDGTWGIFGQRYDASGATLGGEFLINVFTSGDQHFAAVAADPGGAFTVAWTTPNLIQGVGEIAARRFDASGVGGPEFQVNMFTTGVQGTPSVAATSAVSFVVSWTSDNQDGDRHGVFGRRFAIDPIFADGFE
jgi:hypothetical protein